MLTTIVFGAALILIAGLVTACLRIAGTVEVLDREDISCPLCGGWPFDSAPGKKPRYSRHYGAVVCWECIPSFVQRAGGAWVKVWLDHGADGLRDASGRLAARPEECA